MICQNQQTTKNFRGKSELQCTFAGKSSQRKKVKIAPSLASLWFTLIPERLHLPHQRGENNTFKCHLSHWAKNFPSTFIRMCECFCIFSPACPWHSAHAHPFLWWVWAKLIWQIFCLAFITFFSVGISIGKRQAICPFPERVTRRWQGLRSLWQQFQYAPLPGSGTISTGRNSRYFWRLIW